MNDYNRYDDEIADRLFDLFLKALIFLFGALTLFFGIALVANNWNYITHIF